LQIRSKTFQASSVVPSLERQRFSSSVHGLNCTSDKCRTIPGGKEHPRNRDLLPTLNVRAILIGLGNGQGRPTYLTRGTNGGIRSYISITCGYHGIEETVIDKLFRYRSDQLYLTS